eukprot:1841275-Rhodomonas_salina.1
MQQTLEEVRFGSNVISRSWNMAQDNFPEHEVRRRWVARCLVVGRGPQRAGGSTLQLRSGVGLLFGWLAWCGVGWGRRALSQRCRTSGESFRVGSRTAHTLWGEGAEPARWRRTRERHGVSGVWADGQNPDAEWAGRD